MREYHNLKYNKNESVNLMECVCTFQDWLVRFLCIVFIIDAKFAGKLYTMPAVNYPEGSTF